MSAMQTFVRIVPVALILSAGCDDFTGWRTEQAPGPAVAEQKPEPSPSAEEVSDPHQEETIEQVLEFVGRLNQTSEPIERPTPSQEPAVASAAEHQPARSTALVNRPLRRSHHHRPNRPCRSSSRSSSPLNWQPT